MLGTQLNTRKRRVGRRPTVLSVVLGSLALGTRGGPGPDPTGQRDTIVIYLDVISSHKLWPELAK